MGFWVVIDFVFLGVMEMNKKGFSFVMRNIVLLITSCLIVLIVVGYYALGYHHNQKKYECNTEEVYILKDEVVEIG